MRRPRKFDVCKALDQAMDMNAPSIYFAFDSKRGLFDAVLERYVPRRAAHKSFVLAAETAREATERRLYGAIEWLTDPAEPLGCLMVQSGRALESQIPTCRLSWLGAASVASQCQVGAGCVARNRAARIKSTENNKRAPR